MRIAKSETDRDSCLRVIVSTVMMKEASSPTCHDDKSSVWLGSINQSLDTFPLLRSFIEKL